jgi:hypothetical protein
MIADEIRQRIVDEAADEGIELEESDIECLMIALEMSAREDLAQPENKDYFQGAYHYYMDSGATEGDATEEDIEADALRHGITVDNIVQHYEDHVEDSMCNGGWIIDWKDLDWTM